MATNSPNHSSAVQDYIDAEVEDSFAFEDRLRPDEDDPLYDSERVELDDGERSAE